MVHTIGAADMVQLEAEENGWPACIDDVPVGYLYISEPLFAPTVLIQRIAAVPFGVYAIVSGNLPSKGAKSSKEIDISELQHANPDPATGLLCACTG